MKPERGQEEEGGGIVAHGATDCRHFRHRLLVDRDRPSLRSLGGGATGRRRSGEAMKRRGGTHVRGQVRENGTPAVPAPAVACVDAPEAARTPVASGEVVGFEGERGEHVMKGQVLAEADVGRPRQRGRPVPLRRAAGAPRIRGAARSPCREASGPRSGGPGPVRLRVRSFGRRRATHRRRSRSPPPRRRAEQLMPGRGRRCPVQRGEHRAASRRWGLVPVAGAAGALVAGLGGGAAFAFFSGGPATGHVSTGSPVTLDAVATTGSADLLPGDAGAVYFTVHNANPFSATFAQVDSGATVVSDNTGLCPSSDVSIAADAALHILARHSGEPRGYEREPVHLRPRGACRERTGFVSRSDLAR